MKKALSVCLLALAGCGTSGLDLTPCGEVYATKSQFFVLVDKVDRYSAQPVCTPEIIIGCSEQPVVQEMSRALEAIDNALDTAEAQCSFSPDSATIALDTARALLTSLTATYANAIARAAQ